ncbi:MAG TPA: hypothetical protein VFV87_20835 [Pirellulaceae bacterium]|nr:hypothetical protein [Pirellulaceae bacterium]
MATRNMINAGRKRSVSPRQAIKVAVVALAIAAFGAAGLSGALAKHGADDWSESVFGSGSSGGSGWDDQFASGGSGGSGWDDDDIFASGGSGSGGWDDDSIYSSGGWDD